MVTSCAKPAAGPLLVRERSGIQDEETKKLPGRRSTFACRITISGTKRPHHFYRA
jgi:hypothetical protein